MTREEIEAEYKVENGVIRSPGKFESEPVYTPYFYSVLLEGDFGDSEIDFSGLPISVYVVSEDERRHFPELKEVYAVALGENEIGVFCREFMTQKDLNYFKADCQGTRVSRFEPPSKSNE